MLEKFINALSPLWFVFARVTGLRVLQDSTIEALNLDDELTRRCLNGGEGSRAILDGYRANVARILGGDVAMPPPMATTAKEGTPSLDSPAPFVRGALLAPEVTADQPEERKRRGRPAKAKPSAIPPGGEVRKPETHPHTANGVL